MARRPRGVTDEERALWKHAAKDIAPIKRASKTAAPPPAPPKPAPAPPKPAPARASSPSPPAKAPASKLPPLPVLDALGLKLDWRQRRDLKRGKTPIEARLDLHGMTQTEARAALTDFIENAWVESKAAVLVITGKGRPGPGAGASGAPGAPGEIGVLRRMTPRWLSTPPLAARITGFAPAQPRHGGEGAIYVRLRAKNAKVRTRWG